MLSLLTLAFYLYIVLVFQRPELSVSAEGYIDRAFNFSQGKPLQPFDSFYPAGVTYLYAPFFRIFSYDHALTAIAIFQAILLWVTNLIFFQLVRKYFGGSRPAWVAWVLVSVHFPLVLYVGYYFSEIPFYFFFVASLYFFMRAFLQPKTLWLAAFTAGYILGFALLVRGVLYIALPLLLLIAFFSYKPIPWKKISAFLVGLLLVLTLQAVHISLSLGHFAVLPTNGGANAYLAQTPQTLDVRTDDGFWIKNMNLYFDKTLINDAFVPFSLWDSAQFTKLVVRRWELQPWQQLKISWGNVVNLFRFEPQYPFWYTPKLVGITQKFNYAFILEVYIPLLGYFISLFWKSQRGYLWPTLVLLSTFVSILIIAVVTTGEERYLIPFFYPMIALAAVEWVRIGQCIGNVWRKRMHKQPLAH